MRSNPLIVHQMHYRDTPATRLAAASRFRTEQAAGKITLTVVNHFQH
jgi:hypothetical protein